LFAPEVLLSRASPPNAVLVNTEPPPRLLIELVDTNNGKSLPFPSLNALIVLDNGKLSLSLISDG